MSTLFDVYEHPQKGVWGICINAGSARTAELSGEVVKLADLSPLKVAGEVSRRIRQGYAKASRARYLRVTRIENGRVISAEFVERHPELISDLGTVLFTAKAMSDDLSQQLPEWKEWLDKAGVDQNRAQAWINSVQAAGEYLLATADHPAFALILADYAIARARVLSGEKPGMPNKLPKDGPMDWKEWLCQFFDRESVEQAMSALGWSVAHQLNADPSTNDSEDSWLVRSAEVAF